MAWEAWVNTIVDAFYVQHPAWRAEAEAARARTGMPGLPISVELMPKVATWAREQGLIDYPQYLGPDDSHNNTG